METATSTSYCRVCGTDATDKSICDNCGCKPHDGNSFCDNCGSSTLPQAVKCVKCGHHFEKPVAQVIYPIEKKPDVLAIAASIAIIVGYILPWFNFGNLAFHGYDLHEVIQMKEGKWTDQQTGLFQIMSILFIPGFSGAVLIFNLFNEKLNPVVSYVLKGVSGLLTLIFMWYLIAQDDKVLDFISIGAILSVLGAGYLVYDAFANDYKEFKRWKTGIRDLRNEAQLNVFLQVSKVTGALSLPNVSNKTLIVGLSLIIVLGTGYGSYQYLYKKPKELKLQALNEAIESFKGYQEQTYFDDNTHPNDYYSWITQAKTDEDKLKELVWDVDLSAEQSQNFNKLLSEVEAKMIRYKKIADEKSKKIAEDEKRIQLLKEEAQKRFQALQNSANYQSFLELKTYQNQYPHEIKLLQNKYIDQELRKILSSDYDYVVEPWSEMSVPIKIKDNMLGSKAWLKYDHELGVLLVDLETGDLWIARGELDDNGQLVFQWNNTPLTEKAKRFIRLDLEISMNLKSLGD